MKFLRTRLGASPAVAVCLLLLASACGGGGNDSTSTEAEPSTTSTEAGPSTTSAEDPSGWSDVARRAAADGKVVVYGNLDAGFMEEFAAAFEEVYSGITVEYVKGTSAELATRIDQEEQAGIDGADLVITPDLLWASDKASRDGFLAPSGPAFAEWGWSELTVDDAFLPVRIDPFLIAWNTQLVPNGPSGHGDVLSGPDFVNGRVGVMDVVSPTIVALYNSLTGFDENFLEELASLEPRLYPSSTPMAQGLASGEIAVAVGQSPAAVQTVIDAGAPVAFRIPADFAPGINVYAGVLSSSKRPDAAHLFLDYMLSSEGQQLLNVDGSQSPVAEDTTVTPVSYDGLDDAAISAFTERFNTLFK